MKVNESWPQIIPLDLKKKIIGMFCDQTSRNALSTFTCDICGESTLSSAQCKLSIANIDPSHLGKFKWQSLESGSENMAPPPLPFNAGPLKDIMLDPDGVIVDSKSGQNNFLLCKQCFSSVKKKNKILALSLANSMYLGPVPSELKDLTVIEEAMIACC